jgi:HAD superfamily hydrolase (TIGR01484 family)
MTNNPSFMRPLRELPAAHITTVFTDIDDTLTTEGRLGANAYAALQSLYDAGLRVIPVTGRPAGWCDHIARSWPVDGIVGETGSLYMAYDRTENKMHVRHLLDEEERHSNMQRLMRVRDVVLREVPGCAVASDQFCRLYDLAIDFCEDVPSLPQRDIDRIMQIMRDAGMTARASAVHVNGWFGEYDKLSMTKLMMRERYGIDLDDDAQRARCVFIGDSLNDEPMFAHFPLSVGVANVRRFAERLSHLPTFVTQQEYGAGFVELAQHLLAGHSG